MENSFMENSFTENAKKYFEVLEDWKNADKQLTNAKNNHNDQSSKLKNLEMKLMERVGRNITTKVVYIHDQKVLIVEFEKGVKVLDIAKD
jgi:hypothetical protein